MFQLDPQLAQDTLPVGRFPLSLLLLSKDANYPWCILVPQRADVFEIHHLSGEDQQQLIHESSQLSETMTSLFDAYKMNIAALAIRCVNCMCIMWRGFRMTRHGLSPSGVWWKPKPIRERCLRNDYRSCATRWWGRTLTSFRDCVAPVSRRVYSFPTAVAGSVSAAGTMG